MLGPTSWCPRAVLPGSVNRGNVATARTATIERYHARRAELAQSALITLAELGYAKTSLREIAQNSQFTHGVLHYYFSDKNDLILHCVRTYKRICIAGYDEVITAAEDAEQLRRQFAAKLTESATEQTGLHRLWYDLRSQSLFDDAFRKDVASIERSLEKMVGRAVQRYAELSGSTPVFDSRTTYALVDGLFYQCVHAVSLGRRSAPRRLTAQVQELLPRLVGNPDQPED